MKTTFTLSHFIFNANALKNRLHYFVLAFVLVAATYTGAQAQTKLWDKTYGGNDYDDLQKMVALPDGGFLLAGDSYSGKSGDKTQPLMAPCSEYEGCKNDFWIIRTDANGKKLWDKTIGTTNFESFTYDNLTTVVATPDGGFLLGGSTQYDWYDSNYLVIKIDANGNKLWEKQYGGTDTDELRAIVATPDGGFMLAGSSVSSIGRDKTANNKSGVCDSFDGNCPFDNWLVKIDAKGNKVWDKTIGGANSDDLATIVATPDGGYLLGGTSGSSKSGDKSEARVGGACDEYGNCPLDYWVVKVDATGKKVWDKTIGSTNNDNLNALTLATDGSFLVSGTSTTGKGESITHTIWTVKLTNTGAKVWEQHFKKEAGAKFAAQVATKDGGYLLGGSYYTTECEDYTEFCSDDYWVIKLSATGAKQWEKAIKGNSGDILSTMIATNDGHYLLGGRSVSGAGNDKSETNRGQADYWVVKLSGTVTEPAPQIASFSPGAGLPGAKVTITGANLGSATSVLFNGVAAKFKVISKTTLETLVPATAKSGRIQVKTAGGSSISKNTFTVLQPSIVKINPMAAKVGSTVLVTGTHLNTAKEVSINGTLAKSFTVYKNNVLKITVPKGATTGKVSIILAGGAKVTSTRDLKIIKATVNALAVTTEPTEIVAYPNPFSTSVTIGLTLVKPENVHMVVYNSAGHIIRSVAFGKLEAGSQRLLWDGTNNQGNLVTDGIYFYKLTANGNVTTGRLLKSNSAR